MKTSELTGAALDWAVAKCEGVEVWREPDGIYLCEGGEVGFMFRPSTDWSQGGPIIERERIDVRYTGQLWGATLRLNEYEEPDEWFGPTPLIAAMRCYVASQLGDEVEVPDELAEVAA